MWRDDREQTGEGRGQTHVTHIQEVTLQPGVSDVAVSGGDQASAELRRAESSFKLYETGKLLPVIYDAIKARVSFLIIT